MRKKWTASNIPDQTGKTVIVTGANSGLGYQTSLELAKKGARVILACRNEEKGKLAASRILDQVPAAVLELLPLDLSDLSSIRFFAKNIFSKYNKLNLLVNNAGVMAIPLMRTTDQFEMQFGTNHLGHFTLTALLFPILKDTAHSRVITLSSLMHKFGKINFDDLNWEKSYTKWKAYGQSKLANLMFATELQKKLDSHHIKMSSLAAHPGWSSTNLQTKGAELENNGFAKRMNVFANRLLAQSASMGALPGLFAATSPDVKPGAYYGPDGWLKMHGYPVEESINWKLVDPEISHKLWIKSEELSGVKFNFKA